MRRKTKKKHDITLNRTWQVGLIDGMLVMGFVLLLFKHAKRRRGLGEENIPIHNVVEHW